MSATTLQLDNVTARKLYPTAIPEFKTILEQSFPKGFFSQNIMDRIKTYEDACEELGLDPVAELGFKNPINTRQEAFNAFTMLDIISKALLQNVVLDWANSDQKKWYPYFNEYTSGSGFRFIVSYCDWACTLARGGARLCLPTRELADYFGKQFLPIWNKFLNPNK